MKYCLSLNRTKNGEQTKISEFFQNLQYQIIKLSDMPTGEIGG